MSTSTSESSKPSSTAVPSVFCSLGSETTVISDTEIQETLHSFLHQMGQRDEVLILPPDFTRFHSQAGKLTRFICEYYNFVPNGCSDGDEKESVQHENDQQPPDAKRQKTVNAKSEHHPDITILPALGTHVPMTEKQIETMFGKELATKQPNPFLVHDWRKDVVTIGHAPSQMVSDATYGKVDRPWPAQLNKIVWEKRKASNNGKKALILSVGQVVPHEVMGMANFNKNLFVGVGGVEAINLSRTWTLYIFIFQLLVEITFLLCRNSSSQFFADFIGAVHGMEKMMGRASNPLREILNYASEHFLQKELDLWYILTVMGTKPSGEVEMRGFYIGNDINCYNLACELSLKVNFTMLERAPKKVIVHLDAEEFQSTWLGNKAIYRTRMAIADGGELIVLAPGVKHFGEDDEIDKLIREFGYKGTPEILEAMDKHTKLQENLSAVAHLIHGSSEGRFSITYCPGHLTKEEIEGVGFKYDDLDSVIKNYDIKNLKDGWNKVVDQTSKIEDEVYFITNPALGLWAVPSRFDESHGENVQPESRPTVHKITEQVHSTESGGVGGWKNPPSI